MGFYSDRPGITLQQALDGMSGEIESWYGGHVLDVFDNNTLGVMHRYYCSEADQLRMINGKVSNVSMTLMCGPVPAALDEDPVYQWINHSSTECGKVHTAYVTFTKEASTLYQNFKQRLPLCTTIAQVDALFDEMNAA